MNTSGKDIDTGTFSPIDIRPSEGLEKKNIEIIRNKKIFGKETPKIPIEKHHHISCFHFTPSVHISEKETSKPTPTRDPSWPS